MLPHKILSLARLPVPPLPHIETKGFDSDKSPFFLGSVPSRPYSLATILCDFRIVGQLRELRLRRAPQSPERVDRGLVVPLGHLWRDMPDNGSNSLRGHSAGEHPGDSCAPQVVRIAGYQALFPSGLISA